MFAVVQWQTPVPEVKETGTQTSHEMLDADTAMGERKERMEEDENIRQEEEDEEELPLAEYHDEDWHMESETGDEIDDEEGSR